MNSSNLIPMLALAGAGSVMVIFWGASKFTGSSTDSQPEVAVNVSEKTEAATARTPARAESFSWDDEPETTTKTTGKTETVKPAASESAAFDSNVDDVAAEPKANEAFETEPSGNVSEEPFFEAPASEKPFFEAPASEKPFEEFASADEPKVEPSNNPWSSDDSASKSEVLDSSEKLVDTTEPAEAVEAVEPKSPFNEEAASPLANSQPEVDSVWEPASPVDASDSADTTQPEESFDEELVDIEPIREGVESTDSTDVPSAISVPEAVPTYTLSIKNLSTETAEFCVDGQPVTLQPGEAFVTEKSESDTFAYRERCEQISSVSMKAGRYNVKEFPKSAQTGNQAYRARSANN